MNKFTAGIVIAQVIILMLVYNVMRQKIDRLHNRIEGYISSTSQLEEALSICQSQYDTCRVQLQIQNDKVLQYELDKENAGNQHTTDEKENIDDYFDRQQAIQNKEELEGIEYLIKNFMKPYNPQREGSDE